MILSDRDIKQAFEVGAIKIDPWSDDMLQPDSVDLHLASGCWRYTPSAFGSIKVIDTAENNSGEFYYDDTDTIALRPQAGCIASTVERITLAPNIVGRFEGKSSLGRLLLIVHATAGFFDSGWDGQATLEIVNLSPRTIILHSGMRICQMSFTYSMSPSERPYGSDGLGSKYQGQTGPTLSRNHLNFQKD